VADHDGCAGAADAGGQIAGDRGVLERSGIADGIIDRRHIPWRAGGIGDALDEAGEIIRLPRAAGRLRVPAAVARRHKTSPAGRKRSRSSRARHQAIR